jgi:hypothetical protein
MCAVSHSRVASATSRQPWSMVSEWQHALDLRGIDRHGGDRAVLAEQLLGQKSAE